MVDARCETQIAQYRRLEQITASRCLDILMTHEETAGDEFLVSIHLLALGLPAELKHHHVWRLEPGHIQTVLILVGDECIVSINELDILSRSVL